VHPAKPGYPPVYLVQESVPDLPLLSVLPHLVSFLPGGAHGSVASWLGPNQHSRVKNLVPLLVPLGMTSEGLFPEPQRNGFTQLFPIFHYLQQTQPAGATVPNHPVGD